MANSDTGEGLLGYDRRAVRVDLAAIAAVVLVLVALHLLTSPEQKAALAVDSADWFGYTLFTAAYVHFGTLHLLTNVAGYLSACVMAYLLCLRVGKRRWFHVTAVTLLAVVPVLVNAGNALLFVHWGETVLVSARGFSGVVASFGAFVFVVLVSMVGGRDGRVDGIAVATLLSTLLLLQGYVTWTGSPSLFVVGALLVAAGGSLAGLLMEYGLPQTREQVRDGVPRALPVLFGYALLATFVAGLFPTDVTRNGVVLNVYAHAMGAMFGLLLSILTAFLLKTSSRFGDR